MPCPAAEPTNWGRYNGWEIRSFKLEGVPKEFNGSVRNGLAVTGQWKLLSGQQRPEFSAPMLAEDLARIRLFFAVNGYPAAQVVPTAVPNPDTRQLELLITVTPGDPVQIGDVQFTGWPEGVAVPDTSVHGFLAAGQIFSDEALVQGISALRNYFRNAGYALATVSHELVPLGPARIGVHFLLEAGDYYVIDEVVIEGCSDDLLGLARRMVNIEPGDQYSETMMETRD